MRSNMLGFSQYIVEAKAGAKQTPIKEGGEGSKIKHRSNVNELAFAHAIDRYGDLLQKHGDHQKAITALANEEHLHPGNMPKGYEHHEQLQQSFKGLGHADADRTAWDSHHAAISTINHIHNNYGDIAGRAVWTGPDTSGETVKKITGTNTQADILIPTKSGDVVIKRGGHISGSLKYHQDLKKTPTKLFQGTADDLSNKIQKHHMSNFGQRDVNLDNATQQVKDAFSGVSDRLSKHADVLSSAGINPGRNGKYTGDHQDLLRYAHSSLNSPNDKEKARTNGKIRDYLTSNGVPKTKHNAIIQQLANIHDTEVRDPKTTSSRNFAKAVSEALNKSYTQGTSGQNALVRDLLNIRERRKAKVLVIKTQRSKGDHVKDPQGSLPVVSIANHSNDLETLRKRAERAGQKENGIYRSGKIENVGSEPDEEGSSTSTINTNDGKTVARMSIDSNKTSPSVIAQAGNAIDNFKKISDHHPWVASQPEERSKKVTKALSAAPAPAPASRNRLQYNRPGAGRFPQTDSPIASAPTPGINPEADHGGRQWLTPQEKTLLKGHM